MKKLFPGMEPEVSRVAILFRNSESIELPEEAMRFILDFDAGYAVQPFSFEIQVPE